MSTNLGKPKCPQCGIIGIEHIGSQSSQEQHRSGDAWFEVVFCTDCGHVYGVLTKYVSDPSRLAGLR